MRANIISVLAVMLCILAPVQSVHGQGRDAGFARDHPVIARMPGSYIAGYTAKESDRYRFRLDCRHAHHSARETVPKNQRRIVRGYRTSPCGVCVVRRIRLKALSTSKIQRNTPAAPSTHSQSTAESRANLRKSLMYGP